MRVLTSVLLVILCAGISAREQTRFNLEFGNGVSYTFTSATDTRQLASLYGSYQAPMSYTAGTALRIYPNKKFTVVEWCDICHESLLATGTYSFDDGIFTFSYTHKKEGVDSSRFPSELAAFRGWIDKKTYVTGSEYILINPSDVVKARSDTNFIGYLSQGTWYPDWQTMYDNDVANKDEATSAP